jgi:predicted TPR repeat methyltransferase
MRRAFSSSGDLIADRRYQYGLDLHREGDFAAAAQLFEQALERAPRWPAAWRALARARLDAYDRPGAAEALRACLRCDPQDRLGAGLELARIDAAVTVDAAPPAYVEDLFDAYADDFDTALVERLGYATPERLAALLRRMRGENAPRLARALDLGCGTGLGGQAILPMTAWLEGVDLSAGMLDKAREKGIYDRLARSEVISFLAAPGAPADLILAADLFVYFGALAPVLTAAAARLAPGGFMAFSVERNEGADWRVCESLRFAHSEGYVRRVLAAAGLELAAMERAPLRKDRGADVDGLLVIAHKARERMAEAIESGMGAARVSTKTPPLRARGKRRSSPRDN